MKYSVIIPAAGSSQRCGTYDKLLFKINNEPVIKHAISNFHDDKDCRQIILVVKETKFDFYKKMFHLYSKLLVVKGGKTRFESVYEGFKHVKHEYTLIHDAARPYLSYQLLENVKKNLEESDIVVPVVNVVDSMICLKPTNHYVDRSEYKLVQTPEGFKTEILKHAYSKINDLSKVNFSDEASFVLQSNHSIKLTLIDGENKNKKITYESDFEELFCLD